MSKALSALVAQAPFAVAHDQETLDPDVLRTLLHLGDIASVLGLVLDVSRDLLNRLGLKSFLSVGTQFSGNAFNRLAALAFASDVAGH